jgi:hypothetical protein
MGLFELSALAGIVSTVFGGGSLIVSILPFFQLKGRYEGLRKGLRGIRSRKDEVTQSIYGREADWTELIQWLDRGEMLLGLVRERVMRRALLAAVALVGVIATIPIDFPGVPDVSPQARGIEWHDLVAIVVVTIGPRLAFFKKWLLTDAERKFIKNFGDLEEAFYRREVAPKIDLFNSVFQRLFSHVSGSVDDDLAAVREELGDLVTKVDKALSARNRDKGNGPPPQLPA